MRPWDLISRAALQRPFLLSGFSHVGLNRSSLALLRGVHRLIGRLLYGSGMRIMECVRLRVKDVDFSRREILIRDGKGSKDRVTMLPRGVVGSLQEQLDSAREQHMADLRDGFGDVWLPSRLRASFPWRVGSGGGSSCSRPTVGHAIRARTRCGGITSAIRRSSGR